MYVIIFKTNVLLPQTGDLSTFLLSCVGHLIFWPIGTVNLFVFPNFLTWSVPDEGYSRNAYKSRYQHFYYNNINVYILCDTSGRAFNICSSVPVLHYLQTVLLIKM